MYCSNNYFKEWICLNFSPHEFSPAIRFFFLANSFSFFTVPLNQVCIFHPHVALNKLVKRITAEQWRKITCLGKSNYEFSFWYCVKFIEHTGRKTTSCENFFATGCALEDYLPANSDFLECAWFWELLFIIFVSLSICFNPFYFGTKLQ